MPPFVCQDDSVRKSVDNTKYLLEDTNWVNKSNKNSLSNITFEKESFSKLYELDESKNKIKSFVEGVAS